MTVLLVALMSLHLVRSYRLAKETFAAEASSRYLGPIGVNDAAKIMDPRTVKDPSYEHNAALPSVDGSAGAPRALSMFGFNRVSPDCCPNQYMGDGGCVCETDTQRKLLSSRGMNKTHPESPDV
jgi:hypothetical protein